MKTLGPKVWAERWPHIWKPTSGWTGLINRQSFFHWSAFELNFDRKLQTSWRFSQRTLWITGNVENRQWSLKIDPMIVTIFGCSWHFLDSCAQHPRKKYASDEKLLSPTSIVTRVSPTQLGGHRFHAVSMSISTSTPRFSKNSESMTMSKPWFSKKVVSMSTSRLKKSRVHVRATILKKYQLQKISITLNLPVYFRYIGTSSISSPSVQT